MAQNAQTETGQTGTGVGSVADIQSDAQADNLGDADTVADMENADGAPDTAPNDDATVDLLPGEDAS